MSSISCTSTFAILFLVFIARCYVFGASFYEDSFDFERRDAVSDSILMAEHIVINVATDSQVAELEKLVPSCLALPDAALQKLIEQFFKIESGLSVRRKRYVDYMRRFENTMDDDTQGSFNAQRRVSDADRKTIADDLSKFLAKLSPNDRSIINKHFEAAVKGGAGAESRYVALIVKFTQACPAAHKARRLLALRQFLENELMNDDN